MRFLSNLLTPNEQKILLFIAGFFLFGSFLQVSGFSGESPTQAANADSLIVATKTDKILQIDIRTATKEELMSLSGIGSKRADDIIAYRLAHPFVNVNQIMQVKGIGEITYQKMYPNLVIFGDSLALEDKSSPKSKKATDTPKTSTPSKSDNTAKVNLNTASLEELCTLEGIGKTKANAIIEYRKLNGKFLSIEDFTKVKGIGIKTLDKNRHRLILD